MDYRSQDGAKNQETDQQLHENKSSGPLAVPDKLEDMPGHDEPPF